MEADSECDNTCGFAIDDLRLVHGNINDFRHRRNDADVLDADFALIIDYNLLLRRSNEIAKGAGLRAQTLH